MAVSSGRDRRCDRTQTLRRQRTADRQQPTQGSCLADACPGAPGPCTDSVSQATKCVLCARHKYRQQPIERSRSHPSLQSAGPSGGWVPISQRPIVFCLVLVCEETLPDPRALDGDDLRALGLFGDATSTTPPVGAPQRDTAEPDQPTDSTAHLTLGFPTARRDTSGAHDRARYSP